MSNLRDQIFRELRVIGEESDGQYGFYPDQRPINELLNYGFLPLDKPAGQLSHQVVAWVKKMLKAKGAGHSGTLDPMATGLLPVGINHATKALGTLLLGPKEYFAVMRLHSPVPEPELLGVMQEFTTEIYQRPPQRSSVKRVTRRRTIYEMELVERMGNLAIIRVLCEAGTYIRKLVYDMGEVLGVGATMIELRRTRVCNIRESDGLTRLQDLAIALKEREDRGGDDNSLRTLVWPIERALSHMKAIVVKDSAVDAVCHGAQVAVPGIARVSPNLMSTDQVAIYTQKGELVALGKAILDYSQIAEAMHGIAIKTERVIMPAGTYPQAWKKHEVEQKGRQF